MIGFLMTQFNTVKPVLSSHSKIGKTKVLKTGGSLMQVLSIAECSPAAFSNTLTCIKWLSVLKILSFVLLRQFDCTCSYGSRLIDKTMQPGASCSQQK